MIQVNQRGGAANGARGAKKPGAGIRPKFQASLQSDGTLELMIYGDIVDAGTISMLDAWGYSTDDMTCALGIKKAIDAAGSFSKVRLRINSPGGDAFEGMAINSLLSGCGKPVEAYIDGIAASSASIIAMAGGVRVMGRTAMMMIHNAWCGCTGNAADMRKMADTLTAIDESIAASYVDRTGKRLDEIQALMTAETWLGAQACLDGGFATAIAPIGEQEETVAMRMAARFRALAHFRNVPEELRTCANANANGNDCACDCENCQADDCGNCTNSTCDDAHCTGCPMQEDTSAAAAAAPVAASDLNRYQARAKMLLRR